MLRSCGLAALLAAAAPLAARPQDVSVLPPVRVNRVLVDARILDPRGRELRGLLPEDLRVEIDGKPGHLDFTSDRTLLAKALRQALLRDEPPEIAGASGPSLRASLDRDAARRATSHEGGLEVLGRALEKLPGAKSLAFFGWGLGRLEGGRVQMDADYDGARKALECSRTAVFAFDVSKADFHSLEIGLQQVAADTGGFYLRTHNFPVLAMERLRGALSGHYVLALERPAGSRGSHRVAVDLVTRKGMVLARSTYVD